MEDEKDEISFCWNENSYSYMDLPTKTQLGLGWWGGQNTKGNCHLQGKGGLTKIQNKGKGKMGTTTKLFRTMLHSGLSSLTMILMP